MKNEKIKVTIKTDGTPTGTTLIVNGVDVTKQFNVNRVYFSAYAPYASDLCSNQDVFLSWDVQEKDDKGMMKTTTYRLAPGSKVIKGLGKDSLGKESSLQFENDADENTFNVTGSVKKLQDCVEIVEIKDKEENSEE